MGVTDGRMGVVRIVDSTVRVPIILPDAHGSEVRTQIRNRIWVGGSHHHRMIERPINSSRVGMMKPRIIIVR